MKAHTGSVAMDHGADVYDASGALRPGLDFSSTVVSLGPPRGWERRATAAIKALTRYPQPHGRGLDAFLEGALGLAAGSVLVANGASEALEWCARLAAGRRARLVAPCFGEYRAKLERSEATVEQAWWGAKAGPDLEAWTKGLRRGDQLWLANPSNPFGRVLPPRDLADLEQRCAKGGILLVLDEALLAQRLDAHCDPGVFPGSDENPHLAVVRSLGKGLGLPGLRLGYLAAAPALCARLRRFQDPWSVNGMAQQLGAWAFDEERAASVRRRRLLAQRKLELTRRLAGPASHWRVDAASLTGYFCVDLGAPVAGSLSQRLARKGFFVRDCSSYGDWGRSCLRLNPRGSQENRALALAVANELGGA